LPSREPRTVARFASTLCLRRPRRSSHAASASRSQAIYARHTGRSLARVHEDMDRDRYFTAAEACEYGLIDRVIASHELTRMPTGFAAAEGEPDGPLSRPARAGS
jgi:hypothetical protein